MRVASANSTCRQAKRGNAWSRDCRAISLLSSHSKLEDLLNASLRAALKIVSADEGYILLEKQGQIDEAINIYASQPALPEIAIRSRLSKISSKLGSLQRPANIGPIWIFPLVSRGRRIGAIIVSKSSGLTPLQRATLELLSTYSAVSLDNLLLAHNEWSRLPNLSAIKPQIGGAIERNKIPMALLFIDIDDFKSVNSAVGYLGGAELLTQLGQRLTTRVALKKGSLAHISGDEFLFFLTNLRNPKHDIQKVVEVLRSCFSKPFSIAGVRLSITASIGVSVLPDDAGTIDELLEHASRAALMAKRSGNSSYRFYKRSWEKLISFQDFFER